MNKKKTFKSLIKYWNELKTIFDFADKNVTSTIYICWGAQAALYYHYGVKKYGLPEKLFGVFKHKKNNNEHKYRNTDRRSGRCGCRRLLHLGYEFRYQEHNPHAPRGSHQRG